MCFHASWMPVEQCTRCTPPPKVVRPPQPRRCQSSPRRTMPKGEYAYSTDTILHDEDTAERFDAQLTQEGEHLIFHTTRRQFPCNTTRGVSLISPLRYAYSRAFPNDIVTAQELVRVTCGRSGEGHSADGCCVDPKHLIKVRISDDES